MAKVRVNSGIAVRKTALRRTVLARRRQLTATEIGSASRRICAQLVRLDAVLTASAVAVYAAVGGEVDLTWFISFCHTRSKHTLFPRFASTEGEYEMVAVQDAAAELGAGSFGIPEPAATLAAAPRALLRDACTCWIVPGVAFDVWGHRLGRGGGYYDRLLRGVAGVKIGVAYAWQILAEVPHAPDDEPVDILVSDNGVRCAAG